MCSIKNVLLPLIICTLVQNLFAQQDNTFILTGTLQGVDSGMMFLSFYNDKEERSVQDSSVVKNGKFQFKGKLYGPVVAFIRSTRSRVVGNNSTEIFLEPTTMSISLKPNKFLELNLTGSRTQADYEQWRDEKAVMRQPYQKELNLLSDPEYGFKRDSLFAILQPLNEAIRKKDLEFFSKHPQSVATLYFLQYYTRKLSPDSLTRYYSGLGYKLQNTFIGKKIFESISKRSGVVGTLAKSFVTQDINGAIVLSEFFKGKYVLLDFWATWCVPCREGNPHLIKLFAKHKSKNFAIISIADDRDTVAWKKAIEKDGTGLWTHVLRGANPTLKYNGVADPNDLNDKFGVEVLPTMLLLDKTGLIIGRYKGSEEIIELEKKLEEIFKSPA